MAVYPYLSASRSLSRKLNRQHACAGSMPHYQTRLGHVPELSPEEQERLQPVVERFAFRANEYYSSLINWEDPEDPIRKIVIPEVSELAEGASLDPAEEDRYRVAPGLEHLYGDTAVLMLSDACGGFCRFCFRKRMFGADHHDGMSDLGPALEYIRDHPEISDVVLSGGDPLLLATAKLGRVLHQLRLIEHVQIIRIGSKLPAFNPYRILQDESLEEMLREYSTDEKKIYLMAHFNHPRELTEEAVAALNMVQEAGVITMNQTPILKGINSDPTVLNELLNRLSTIGVQPYYVYQCRPSQGNRHFMLPVEQAYKVFEKARMKGAGLVQRARFVMSHGTGKVEVLGRARDQIFMRYHRAANCHDKGLFMMFKSNPGAYWFDDYLKAAAASLDGDPSLRLSA